GIRPGGVATPKPRAPHIIGRLHLEPQLTAACAVFMLISAAVPDVPRDTAPPPSPPIVSPQGRILFSDDFSSDSLRVWEPDRAGVWTIRNGMLRGDLPDLRQERSLVSIAGSHWRDVR